MIYNFVIVVAAFTNKSGGTICMYALAKTLKEMGHNAYVYDCIQTDVPGRCIENPIFNDYFNGNVFPENYFQMNETIVIYPEIVSGNPLKARRVIRWLLCDIGVQTLVKDIHKTWDMHDRVYVFSPFTKFGNNIRQLFVIYINPIFKDMKGDRKGSCFTLRKANKFHEKIEYIHDKNSEQFEDISEEEMVTLFNQKEYVYCYDPYSYIPFVAALCGCIPIVYPVENKTKEKWLESLFVGDCMKKVGIKEVYGIAYGNDEIEYAKKTLGLVREQQEQIIEYGKTTVQRMIDDLNIQDVNTTFDFWKDRDYVFWRKEDIV